jgi:hypothetical protein
MTTTVKLLIQNLELKMKFWAVNRVGLQQPWVKPRTWLRLLREDRKNKDHKYFRGQYLKEEEFMKETGRH